MHSDIIIGVRKDAMKCSLDVSGNNFWFKWTVVG